MTEVKKTLEASKVLSNYKGWFWIGTFLAGNPFFSGHLWQKQSFLNFLQSKLLSTSDTNHWSTRRLLPWTCAIKYKSPFFYSKFFAKFPGNKSPAQRACCENKENEHRFDCSLLWTSNTLWAQSCGNRSAPTTKIIATHSVEQVNMVKPKALWRRQLGPSMPPPPRPAPSCRQSGL